MHPKESYSTKQGLGSENNTDGIVHRIEALAAVDTVDGFGVNQIKKSFSFRFYLDSGLNALNRLNGKFHDFHFI